MPDVQTSPFDVGRRPPWCRLTSRRRPPLMSPDVDPPWCHQTSPLDVSWRPPLGLEPISTFVKSRLSIAPAVPYWKAQKKTTSVPVGVSRRVPGCPNRDNRLSKELLVFLYSFFFLFGLVAQLHTLADRCTCFQFIFLKHNSLKRKCSFRR